MVTSLFDWYLGTACAAARRFQPHHRLLCDTAPVTGLFSNGADVFAWLEAERVNISAAVRERPIETWACGRGNWSTQCMVSISPG